MRLRSIAGSILFLSLTMGCSSSDDGSADPVTVPGQAALQITVAPNPIQARHVSGDTYDFPFTVSLRERNGVAVTVDRVSIDVRALGAIPVYSESLSREQIAQRGYPTSLRGGGELRYSLTPRKEVPDDRLFGGVAADVRVDATDANGNHVSATTVVTVTR